MDLGRSEYPAIRVCKEHMLFCSTVIKGMKTEVDERGRKHFQMFRGIYSLLIAELLERRVDSGLALNPRKGIMCWIETFHLASKIKCSNMDGSDVSFLRILPSRRTSFRCMCLKTRNWWIHELLCGILYARIFMWLTQVCVYYVGCHYASLHLRK